MSKYGEIDINNLEKVLQSHSSDFFDDLKEYHKVKENVRLLKLQIDELESKLNLTFRSDFESKGVRFTESKISSLIKTDPIYMGKYKTWITASSELARLDLLKEYYIQKDNNLKGLVSLYVAKYWSLNNTE